MHSRIIHRDLQLKLEMGSVRFDQTDSSVRFGSVQFMFGLSNGSGSFGSVRLAKDVASSSVRLLFDSQFLVWFSPVGS